MRARPLSSAHGVIVGRFQVPDLHAGHRFLIEHVRARHESLLVVLGTTNAPDERNPLSYEARRDMLLETYPGIAIAPLSDHPSDAHWSALLDTLIREHAEDALLYGSRDSFLSVYTGVFRTTYIEPVPSTSGTEVRRALHTAPHAALSPRARAIRDALSGS